MKVLVTGSNGHLAQYVIPALRRTGHTPIPFDLPARSILNPQHLQQAALAADACVHLAGMKYADRGELHPLEAVNINVQGTAAVINAFGPNTVIASTCKAADPETVYGCSKLIAERFALNQGAKVVRFVNVLGSAGSVTDIWDKIPATDPLPVCNATRLFMTPEQAAALIVDALDWPSGRYAPRTPRQRHMADIATELYPDRPTTRVPLRRGDRRHERLLAACEHSEPWTATAVRIYGQHDPEAHARIAATVGLAA